MHSRGVHTIPRALFPPSNEVSENDEEDGQDNEEDDNDKDEIEETVSETGKEPDTEVDNQDAVETEGGRGL